jgi:hypothetical protein
MIVLANGSYEYSRSRCGSQILGELADGSDGTRNAKDNAVTMTTRKNDAESIKHRHLVNATIQELVFCSLSANAWYVVSTSSLVQRLLRGESPFSELRPGEGKYVDAGLG